MTSSKRCRPKEFASPNNKSTRELLALAARTTLEVYFPAVYGACSVPKGIVPSLTSPASTAYCRWPKGYWPTLQGLLQVVDRKPLPTA
jgi:hypothetical protein